MRWIYLSPHLDDAVLSAGGLIHDQAQAGIPVEIWTLMSGFPPDRVYSQFAQLQHYLWGYPSAEEAVRARREEDRRAADILGAEPVHLDFLDCIYRRGPDGEWLYSDISVPLHAQDAGLTGHIAQEVSARLRPDDVVVCQLALVPMWTTFSSARAQNCWAGPSCMTSISPIFSQNRRNLPKKRPL